jgi:hypothetical protein
MGDKPESHKRALEIERTMQRLGLFKRAMELEAVMRQHQTNRNFILAGELAIVAMEGEDRGREEAKKVVGEAERLLYSLGEYVRQTMSANPEWSQGVASLEAALLEYKKAK